MMKLSKTLLAALALSLSVGVHADGESGGSGGRKAPGVAPVKNELFLEECGSCHFAYQPGLLPQRSWEKVMSGLANHFGDNAELDAETLAELKGYVMEHAADQAVEKRSTRIMRSLGRDEAPLRITDTPYIKRQHDEIPMRYIKHEAIGSLSNCTACHQKAAEGLYGERWIEIPGVGRWEH